jgi:hypothetical protein
LAAGRRSHPARVRETGADCGHVGVRHRDARFELLPTRLQANAAFAFSQITSFCSSIMRGCTHSKWAPVLERRDK